MAKLEGKQTCLLCGSRLVEAGTSNLIDGCRYKGLKELAHEDWIVCPQCYKQSLQTGDWHKEG